MKILVYGAGVLGSLYAAKLHEAGQDVTILARGQRLRDIRENGIVLVDDESGRQTTADVRVSDQLAPDDDYELVMVLVRKNQVAALLPSLAANRYTPSVMFMTNNAAGSDDLIAALGRERVLLGFPGAGGALENGIVHYSIVDASKMATKIGEVDGSISARIEQIAGVLRGAGFGTMISPEMPAWLKSHAALIVPAACAIYMAGGSTRKLAKNRAALRLLFHGLRECLRVLRALDVPVTPSSLRKLALLPDFALIWLFGRSLNSERAELLMARHANHARDEMQCLADEFRVLIRQSGVRTPAFDQLVRQIGETPIEAPSAERQEIPMA